MIALPGSRVAGRWWNEGPVRRDMYGAGVWLAPRETSELVELHAHDGALAGLCTDAGGTLVSWGWDGVLARWDLPAP